MHLVVEMHSAVAMSRPSHCLGVVRSQSVRSFPPTVGFQVAMGAFSDRVRGFRRNEQVTERVLAQWTGHREEGEDLVRV